MSLFEDNKDLFDSIYSEFLNEYFANSDYLRKMESMCDSTQLKLDELESHKKEEYFNNTVLFRIIKVYRRLLLVRNLNKQRDLADIGLIQFLYPGLITYLTLTCFDQLGQDIKGWIFFPDWLLSKKLKTEREAVIEKISKKLKLESESNQINFEYLTEVYSEYHKLYGMKNSFIYFIQKVLNEDQKEKLLNSIIIETKIHEENRTEIIFENDSQKINWLYALRNNYTHSLDSQEKHFRNGIFTSSGVRYIWEQSFNKKSNRIVFVTENFKHELENSVIIGLVETINNN